MAAPAWMSIVCGATRLRGSFARSSWLVIAPFLYCVQLGIELPYRIQYVLGQFWKSDFIALYTGATIFSSDRSHLYDPTKQLLVERGIDHLIPGPLLFVNPPLAAGALRPFAQLSFRDALIVFLVVSSCALVGSALLLQRLLPSTWPAYKRTFAVVAAIGYAGIENLGVGQWGALQLLALVGGLALAKSRRPVAGGCVLAAILVKPQIGLLLLPALLVGRHWRVLLGMTIGCSVWAVSSLLLVGVGGTWSWLQDLGALNTVQGSSYDGLPAIANATLNTTAGFVTSLILMALCVVGMIAVRARLRESLAITLGAGVMASFVSAAAIHNWDAGLLAIPLILVIRNDYPGGLLLAFSIGVSTLIPHATALVVTFWIVLMLIRWLQTSHAAMSLHSTSVDAQRLI